MTSLGRRTLVYSGGRDPLKILKEVFFSDASSVSPSWFVSVLEIPSCAPEATNFTLSSCKTPLQAVLDPLQLSTHLY